MEEKREAGGSPARSRHCNQAGMAGRGLLVLPLRLWRGKVSTPAVVLGSQETCLKVRH